MKWTLNLGKLLGVNIKVHWTFFLLLLWVVFLEYNKGSNANTIVLTTVFVLTIFACVVLHEMGHILMARRFGINTRKITLLPIGGVASLERIPENPKKELLVAIAGPLVNVVIAAIIFPFLGDLTSYMPTEANHEVTASITTGNFWFNLFVINIVLVLFNLLPAFPMDGGRMFRSLLAMKMGRLKATGIASATGQILAIIFFFAGLFFNPFLVLIGVFVFFGARGEHYMVQQTELMRGHHVSEAMITNIKTLESSENIKDVQDQLISSCDDIFAVTHEHEFRGIVRRNDILKALQSSQNGKKIDDLVLRDFDSIKPSDLLSKIVPKIRQHGQSTFPVLEGKELKGLISLDSIQRFLVVQGSLGY